MPISSAFPIFPQLQTQRLHLRAINAGDMDAIFALYSLDAVAEHLDIDTFTSCTEAEELAAFFERSYREQFAIRWAITLGGEGKLIGTCGYNGLDADNRRAEIGYDLAPAYWRQGIMAEALRAVLHYAFTTLDLHRVEAITAPGNLPSQALLERLGFCREGYLRQRSFYRGIFRDDVLYGLLRDEFLTERQQ